MASVGFRWLDILEKEFDKAFVDLDLAIGELDSEEPDVVYSVRQKLCTLSSCFAQLTHKAQTIFQNSTKIEAELIHMRAELVESKSKREILDQELHNLLLQLHSSQLAQLPGLTGNRIHDPSFQPDVNNIKKKFEDELKKSPNHNHLKDNEEIKFSPVMVEVSQMRNENTQLQLENAALRNSILALNSEVYGAKLAAKYLDKELAGRIQQLQLLGREMRGDVRDKLWRQLESEILLQRHKTVVRACRRNSLVANSSDSACAKPTIPVINEEQQHFGDVRTVMVKRKTGQGLGISITGGREHGVPILISELEPNGPAALSGQLYIGDAILLVNDRDLRQACHREAVDILQKQTGDCRLQVQYIAADDSDNSLEEDGFNFRFFDSEVCDANDSINLHPLHSSGVMNTPTAPRTPESSTHSRAESRSQEYENLVLSKPVQLQDLRTKIDLNKNNSVLISLDTDALTDNQNAREHTFEINSNEVCITTEQTPDFFLNDNQIKNAIFRKNAEENLNCSSNSLVSDNLSSPMQTSTDVFLDSEILSTDVASNDSQSPKNVQSGQVKKKSIPEFSYESSFLEVKALSAYRSTETFSNPKSDQSLLNSPAESYDSSPVHKINRDYKKAPKKKSKKYFGGVKTLQNIFSKHDGYSDLSSTASEVGETPPKSLKEFHEIGDQSNTYKYNPIISGTTPEFDENIHNFLSETVKNYVERDNEKHFKLNGQNLRVGKALTLSPKEPETERKVEKLLARYVYSSTSLRLDGVGDSDFGTPV